MTTLSLARRTTDGNGQRSAVRDCFYHWFSELERGGEDIHFRLGRVSEPELAPSWICLPHHTFDGLGGLAHVLREGGQELPLPVLPGPYPHVLRRSLAALRHLLRPNPKPRAFKSEVSGGGAGRPVTAWALFTEGQTSALRERAREGGTSLNALFLYGLTSAIRPLLADGPGVVNWIVPVNMRGAERGLALTDNQASAFDVAFPPDADARAIDDVLREQRSRNVHWAVWELLRWLGAAGPAVVRAAARQQLSVRKHGSFSNMGSLDSQRRSPGSREPVWWMAINPVQRTRPLGAACLTFNGRLALTLQAHSVLGLEQSGVERILDAWIAALQRPVSTEITSTAGTTTLAPGSGGTNFT